VIADRFELESVAGQGGMGVVYRASDRLAGVPVAVKVMTTKLAGAAERFDREARALASLDHPGIVRYVMHGQTPDGHPWLAMEWLEGEDLGQRLAREGLRAGEAVDLIRHAAAAVGVAHQRGIVHRDLKPGNLFLVDRDPTRVKVLDFGIARLGVATMALTVPGQVLGTPSYMAPEQARGQAQVGAAADVWSLGAVLYECLCGHPPFIGDVPVAVLMKAILEDAPPLREVAPDVPADVEALVARMLAREPTARIGDASAAAAALYELTVDAVTEPPPRRSAPPPAITGAEQELIAVVLGMAADLTAGDTLVHGGSDDATHVDAGELGAQVERLVDGSAMVVFRGEGHATDLAVRAAEAALDLRRRLGPDHRVALAMGRAQVDQRVPAGEVVDRAAALASTGPAAGVRLDELTAGLLPARFAIETTDHGPRLTGERRADDGVRTLLGRPTPCVGRKKELRMLRAVVDEAFEEEASQAALLVGPAGCGKTRLRHELVRELRQDEPDVEVWIGRGDPVAAGSSFSVLTRALAGTFGVSEGEPLETRRERIAARVARHVPEPERARVAEFLGELLGAPFDAKVSQPLRAARTDLQLMGDQLRRAVLDLLAAETAAHPLLLVLEDMQWGDLPSVSLLEAALTRLAERPFMLLATSRPEIDERFVNLWREHGMEQLHLSPLSRRAAVKLARHVLGDDATDEAVERIVARAEGNAYFLEELLRAEAEGRGGELPATLVAVAQARIDALEPEARRVLRAASVTGLTFWPGCVRALLGGERTSPDLDAWLGVLERGEIFERRPQSRFANEAEHAFRQDVVREAAYRSFTDADRQTAHLLAAQWLEAAGERDAVAIAEHLERAGRPAEACEHWIRGAEQALEGNDLDAAPAHAQRAIDAGADGELLGRAHLVRCVAASWQLDYEPAVPAAREAMDRLTPGSAEWFEAATVGVACTKAMGRREDAKAFVDALVAAPRDVAPSAAAIALATAASHLLYAGDVQAATETGQAARRAAERSGGDASVLAKLALLSAREAAFRGDMGEYAENAAASKTLFEAAGDLRRTLNQQSNYGYALLELGRYEEAERELATALQRAVEAGNSRVAAFARHNLGMVLALLGRADEGGEHERLAIEEFRAGGHARLEAGSRVYLAQILQLAGDLDGALAEARAAVVQLETVAPPLRPLAHATVARICLARGELDAALAASAEAIGTEGAPIEAGESLVRLARAEALHAAGDAATARSAISDAAARLHERAEKIRNEEDRRSFLERVPENALTLHLARAWAGTIR